jgi:hypothetical protein
VIAAERKTSLHGNLAIPGLLVEEGRRCDQNVHDLALSHSLGELRRGIELHLDLVAACAFELFCRALQPWFHRAGGQHFDVSRCRHRTPKSTPYT